MPARMTRKHQEAHDSLCEWASFIITHQTSQELGYQIADWLAIHSGIPPAALVPRLAMTPIRVRLVFDWHHDIATDRLRQNAENAYLFKTCQLTRSQQEYLLDSLGEYMEICNRTLVRRW